MTRIAIMIGQLGLGGAEKQLCQLASGLRKWNFRPLVVSLSPGGDWEGDLRARGVDVTILSRNGSFDIRRVIQAAKLLEEFKPEIVHGFDCTGSIYGRLAGALAGVPMLIGGVRSAMVANKRVLYIERLLRDKTDAIISNSFAGKRT